MNIKEHPAKKHMDRKLIFRIRIFYVIAIFLTGLMLYDVLEGIIGFELSFGGFLLGLFLGFIATRSRPYIRRSPNAGDRPPAHDSPIAL